MDDRPIGIFDSGIGGLTVLKEIKKILKSENLIYYGDTARVPYGPRPASEILQFSIEGAKFLVKKNIKALVLACNTMTAISYEYLKDMLDIPIIGVIDSGVRAVLKEDGISSLGIIATSATVDSKVYQKKILRANPSIQIKSKACPMFVSIVEEGWADTDIARLIIEKYLVEEEDFRKMDGLVLACTHFPVLKNTIINVLGEKIKIIDPAEETAKELKVLLKDRDLISPNKDEATYSFYVSDKAEKFRLVASKITQVDKVSEVQFI